MIRKLSFLLSLLLWLFSSVRTEAQSVLEQDMEHLGLVDVATLDPPPMVSLMYAQSDNFVGKVLYTDLSRAYLHPDAAAALQAAHRALKQLHPDYTLIVYDAARPMRVQQQMWDKVKGTAKQNYVSNPRNGGGLHNYGLAVDLSIADSLGHPLDMGTPVDYLGVKAHIDREEAMLDKGVLTAHQVANRHLLRRVMHAGGFRPLRTEWWHFNLTTREVARKQYKVIR